MKRILLTAVVAMAAMAAGAQEYADSTQTETDLLKRELAQREAELAQRDAELAQRDAELAEIERRNIDKAIWSPGRFTKLGFNFASTGDGFNAVDKSQYSFTLSKGASYMFPSRPVAGMLKFGFDMTWFDFTFTKYKTPSYGVGGGWTSEIEHDYDNGYYDDEEEDFDLNLGRMSLSLGALGIGPRVSIAPFSGMNNACAISAARFTSTISPR
ncbi:MAG: hypothetical protein K2I51_06730, partial [Muribaculaceae bacterium]|nr:hypothetical protein [Muribaculaceae bacterium]